MNRDSATRIPATRVWIPVGAVLMQRGAVEFWSFLRTGRMGELVPVMVLLGGIGHFVLIRACLAALFDRRIEDTR